jgi:chemotaxis protein MotB
MERLVPMPVTNAIKRRLIIGSVVSAVILTGCVSRSDYDKLQAENRDLQSSNQDLQTKNQQLQQQAAVQSADIDRLRGAIKYTVNSDLLFPSGGYQMSARGQQIIASMAMKLAPSQQNKILVNGYTDNHPVGPELERQGISSNQVLSEKRAENVMAFMITQGVKAELVSAHGFGDADPVAPNDTASGRAQNRRVELSLAAPGS